MTTTNYPQLTVEVCLDQRLERHLLAKLGHAGAAPDRAAMTAGYLGVMAYCTVTIGEAWIMHDVVVINTPSGTLVSMPARKYLMRWPCGHKNPYDHRFCGACGAPATLGPDAYAHKHMDVCHPANQAARVAADHTITGAVTTAMAAWLAGTTERSRPSRRHESSPT